MPSIPHDPKLDSSLALLADPYGFIARRCRKYGADLFEARIMFRSTICLSGASPPLFSMTERGSSASEQRPNRCAPRSSVKMPSRAWTTLRIARVKRCSWVL
jgi:hypothetical protein